MDATTRTILWCCGAVNALFALFHLLLFLMIARLPGLEPGVRALLMAFNVGGTLMILFLALAFLACPRELSTRLGRLSVLLGMLVYLTRAVGEVVFFPHPSRAILVVCVVTGLLHLVAFRRAIPRNA
jgi:hypothetical protein